MPMAGPDGIDKEATRGLQNRSSAPLVLVPIYVVL